jgi:N-acyl-D-aspartate/D-glutamate deacylase
LGPDEGGVALIEEARRRGVNVQANVYPYTRGNNDLVSIIPPWAHEGGRSKLVSRLKDSTQRARLKQDISNGLPGWYNHYTAVGGDWSRLLISANNPYKGLTMDHVLARKSAGQTPPPDPLDILFDLLIEQEAVSTVYAHHTEEDMNLPWPNRGARLGPMVQPMPRRVRCGAIRIREISARFPRAGRLCASETCCASKTPCAR